LTPGPCTDKDETQSSTPTPNLRLVPLKSERVRHARYVRELASLTASVVTDLSAQDPDLTPFLEHVRDPHNGYTSICVPLDDGVELSTRTH
jgi:hypothetical protein